MKLSKVHIDAWMGGLLIVLSVIFYLMAGQFSNPEAATWPKVILVCIIILSVMLLIRGLRLTQQNADPGTIPANVMKGPMATIVMIIVYAIAMNFTGYFVSTAIFLPLGMFALGQRSWKAIVGVTVVLEVFIYVLFVTQLQLRMP